MWVTATVGGGSTIKVSVSPALLPPAEKLTGPVSLDRVPVWPAINETDTVQAVPGFSEPALSEKVCEPAAAVTTLVDPQVPFSPLGLSTVRPAGSASVNEIDDTVPVAFGLVMVTESAVASVSPTPIRFGVNPLVMVGGAVAASAVGAEYRPMAATAAIEAVATPVNVRAFPVLTAVRRLRAIPCNSGPLLRKPCERW
jgi:hypothetical protein